jgi:hypothetical protein
MSHCSPRTTAPPPCLPLGIKDWLERNCWDWIDGFGLAGCKLLVRPPLTLLQLAVFVSPPEQLSLPRTVYMGFRKVTLRKAKERTWDSGSLKTKNLREIKENMGQCKCKERL